MAEETKQQEKKDLTEKKNREGAEGLAKEENREPKISTIEIFFITPFYLLSDAFDYLLFFMAMDDFGIMDTIRTSISQFYFVWLKRMGPEIWVTNLVINGIKLFPYIGSLLPSTLVWIVVIFIDRGAMNKIKKIDTITGGRLVRGLEKVGKIK